MTLDYRKEYNRDPDANALFHFELDGIRFLHMGDTDNHLLEDHLKELEGNVDVLLAHADAHATIAPDELDKVITRLKTKAVIPMHYDGAKGVLKIEPVETFLGHCKPENVTRVKGSTLDLTGATLPKSDTPHIYVLEQSKLR